MGSCTSHQAVSDEATASEADPRWDEDGFKRWADQTIDGEYALAWVKVGYIRRVANSGQKLLSRVNLPKNALHLGNPPSDVQLFNVSMPHLTWDDPDPEGKQLCELCQVLDSEGAEDSALVVTQFTSFHSPASPLPTSTTERLLDHVDRERHRLCSFARIRTIVLPRVFERPEEYDGWITLDGNGFNEIEKLRGVLEEVVDIKLSPSGWFTIAKFRSHEVAERVIKQHKDGEYGDKLKDLRLEFYYRDSSYLERGLTTYELYLVCYCQRIMHAKGDSNNDIADLIQKGTDPEFLADVKRRINQTKFVSLSDRVNTLHNLQSIFSLMPSPNEDRVGFEWYCKNAAIAWLKVEYVRELADLGGPFPRRQELNPERIEVGVPPAGRQTFVATHCWESEVHPSPSGCQMVRLAEKLKALNAADDDVVFYDYCSLSQDAKMGKKIKIKQDNNCEEKIDRDATAEPYFTANGVAYISDRTHEERVAFSFALWDMGRLYSYKECRVIVLPTLADIPHATADDLLGKFPGGNVWGHVNARPYHMRGWCVAEFSIARFCGTIANLSDPDVQEMMKSRAQWPETVAQYANMMDEHLAPSEKVVFTNKGDRHAVKFNFFKMTFSDKSLSFGELSRCPHLMFCNRDLILKRALQKRREGVLNEAASAQPSEFKAPPRI